MEKGQILLLKNILLLVMGSGLKVTIYLILDLIGQNQLVYETNIHLKFTIDLT